MSFGQEVKDFASVYKTLAPSPQDKYYGAMYELARGKVDDERERRKAGKTAVDAENARRRAARNPQQFQPTMPTTANPQTAMATGMPPPSGQDMGWQMSGTGGTYRRGGKVKRYAFGGEVEGEMGGPDDDQDTADDNEDYTADTILEEILQQKGDQPQPEDAMVRPPQGAPNLDALNALVRSGQTGETGGQPLTRAMDTSPPSRPGSLPMPQMPPQPAMNIPAAPRSRDPADEINARGRLDRARQQQMERNIPSPQGPTSPTEPTEPIAPSPPYDPTGGQAAAAGTMAGPRSVGTDVNEARARGNAPSPALTATAPGEERTSLLGRTVAPAVDAVKADYARSNRIAALKGQIMALSEGLLTQTTAGERAAREAKIAPLRAELDQLNATPSPPPAAASAAAPVTPQQGSTQAVAPGMPPVAGTPPADIHGPLETPTTSDVVAATGDPTVTSPGKPAPKPVTPPARGTGTTPTNGTNGPVQGNGASPAPPPGATSANTPTAAPKPGSLRDPTRIRAFDPVADRDDPNNARRVSDDYMSQDPAQFTPQQLQNIVGSAALVAPRGPNGEPPPVGTGAASRENVRALEAKYNPQGDLTPGEARLVGMVAEYQVLLRQGRIKEAAMMAYGVIQASNLEAAAYGKVAIDQMRGGDQLGAAQSIASAADYSPDGKKHEASPDGRFIITTDPRTGQTARMPLNGQTMLKLATGFADGTLLWQTLLQSASLLTQDKNAEGRMLSNTLKRLQIEKAERGLRGGGGAAATPAASEADEMFRRSGATPSTTRAGSSNSGDLFPGGG